MIDGCAAPQPGRARTWINARIRNLYRKLYEIGHCHTVEVYEDDELVGGLYGVSLGRAFFGESMFHRARDASKVALVHLVARLRAGGFRCSTPSSSPTTSRPSARSKCRAGSITSCSDAALVGEADFAALRPPAMTGAEALRHAQRRPRRLEQISVYRAVTAAAATAASAAAAVRLLRLLLRGGALRRARGARGAGAGWRLGHRGCGAPLQSVSQTS